MPESGAPAVEVIGWAAKRSRFAAAAATVGCSVPASKPPDIASAAVTVGVPAAVSEYESVTVPAPAAIDSCVAGVVQVVSEKKAAPVEEELSATVTAGVVVRGLPNASSTW